MCGVHPFGSRVQRPKTFRNAVSPAIYAASDLRHWGSNAPCTVKLKSIILDHARYYSGIIRLFFGESRNHVVFFFSRKSSIIVLF